MMGYYYSKYFCLLFIISKSKSFFISSIILSNTALFSNLNISFSKLFLVSFFFSVLNSMQGFNIFFCLNLIVLCIFLSCNLYLR